MAVKGAVLATAVLAAVVGLPVWLLGGHGPHPSVTNRPGPPWVARAVAVAEYRVWNTFDCDGSGDYSCDDDSQNLNHAPWVGHVRAVGSFAVVPIAIWNGNVAYTYCVRVDRRTWQAVSSRFCPTEGP